MKHKKIMTKPGPEPFRVVGIDDEMDIEPQMTHLASLASGIVERRGGMLVHSSIIARELGIPSVNGVSCATELLNNGDLLTVNGYLGLVVVGEPEFHLEHGEKITS